MAAVFFWGGRNFTHIVEKSVSRSPGNFAVEACLTIRTWLLLSVPDVVSVAGQPEDHRFLPFFIFEPGISEVGEFIATLSTRRLVALSLALNTIRVRSVVVQRGCTDWQPTTKGVVLYKCHFSFP